MKHKILPFLSLLLFISCTLNAQGFLHKQADNKGLIMSARFRTDSLPTAMSNAKNVLNSLNKMKSDDEWRIDKADMSKHDTRHQYYLQYYKGIRVAYGIYSMHGNNKGELESAIGNYQKFDKVNISAQLSEPDALQYAMKYIGADVYKWQVPEEEKWIKEYFDETYYPKGELLIVKDLLQGSNQYRLAYKFDIYPISH